MIYLVTIATHIVKQKFTFFKLQFNNVIPLSPHYELIKMLSVNRVFFENYVVEGSINQTAPLVIWNTATLMEKNCIIDSSATSCHFAE